MRTIILTYPGFQSLPRGVKQLLLASESFYFAEAESAAAKTHAVRPNDAHSDLYPVVTNLGQPVEMRTAA